MDAASQATQPLCQNAPRLDQGKDAMRDQEMTAPEQDIDVWLAVEDEIDEAARAGFGALMTAAEREQQQRFRFDHDRSRYLITRGMVRTVLSQYADIAPADWTFECNDYGRPHIAPRHGEACALSFNISHSRGLIALAVARHRALGVDVEQLTQRPVSMDIAQRYFAPVEVADLARVPQAGQQDRFFEYWTLKESYIKARGMGLSIPLDQFAFHYPHEHAVQLTVDPALGDDAGRWRFWQCRPTPDHLLALCAEQGEGPAPTVRFHRLMAPTARARLELTFLRTSGGSHHGLEASNPEA